MADDLDTAAALKILASLAAEIGAAAQAGQSVQATQGAVRTMGRLVGLCLDDGRAETGVVSGWNQRLAQALPHEAGAASR